MESSCKKSKQHDFWHVVEVPLQRTGTHPLSLTGSHGHRRELGKKATRVDRWKEPLTSRTLNFFVFKTYRLADNDCPKNPKPETRNPKP